MMDGMDIGKMEPTRQPRVWPGDSEDVAVRSEFAQKVAEAIVRYGVTAPPAMKVGMRLPPPAGNEYMDYKYPGITTRRPFAAALPLMPVERGGISYAAPPPLADRMLLPYRSNGHAKTCKRRDRKRCSCAADLRAMIVALARVASESNADRAELEWWRQFATKLAPDHALPKVGSSFLGYQYTVMRRDGPSKPKVNPGWTISE